MLVIPSLILFFVLAVGFIVYCLIATPVWLLASDWLFPRMPDQRRTGVGCLLLPTSYVLLLVFYFSLPSNPTRVFEHAFGFEPPPDVGFRYCSEDIFGDSGKRILNFSAGRKTVDQIVERRFETSLGASDSDEEGVFTFSRESSGSFAWEHETLTFDAETGAVRYEWEGID